MTLATLAKNVLKLLSANAVAAVLSIVTLVLTARAVGPTGLGILALVEAYGRVVDRIVRFEPWQALIRYGVAAIDEERTDDLRSLVKFCLVLDVIGAVAASAVALIGIAVAGRWIGLSGDGFAIAIAFSVSLVFGGSSTGIAILRMYGRFWILAQVTVITATVRLAATAAVVWADGSLLAFGAVLVVQQVVSNGLILGFGLREARRRDIGDAWRAPLRGVTARTPRLAAFIVNSNLNLKLRHSVERFDVLIVGGLLGATDAGLYQLARRIGTAAQKFDGPLRQATYPEFAKLAARQDFAALRRYVLMVNGAVASLGAVGLLGVAPFLPELVSYAFGAAFVPAAPILFLQLVAITLFLAGSTLTPTLLSLGADAVLLRITLGSTAAFFVALYLLLTTTGITHATFAHVIYNVVWLSGCLIVFLAATSARRHRAPSQGIATASVPSGRTEPARSRAGAAR